MVPQCYLITVICFLPIAIGTKLIAQSQKMSKLHFTTKHANAATVQHNWYVVDGTNQTVGRMCAKIAAVLRGKNKAYYTPHVDCGDYIIVINADKVKFTGNKMEEKEYLNLLWLSWWSESRNGERIVETTSRSRLLKER